MTCRAFRHHATIGQTTTGPRCAVEHDCSVQPVAERFARIGQENVIRIWRTDELGRRGGRFHRRCRRWYRRQGCQHDNCAEDHSYVAPVGRQASRHILPRKRAHVAVIDALVRRSRSGTKESPLNSLLPATTLKIDRHQHPQRPPTERQQRDPCRSDSDLPRHRRLAGFDRRMQPGDMCNAAD